MDIRNSEGASVDIGGGGVHCPQRRGGQEVATKRGEGRMDIKCNMADGGLEGRTTEGRESKHKGGTEGAA